MIFIKKLLKKKNRKYLVIFILVYFLINFTLYNFVIKDYLLGDVVEDDYMVNVSKSIDNSNLILEEMSKDEFDRNSVESSNEVLNIVKEEDLVFERELAEKNEAFRNLSSE